MKKVIFVLVLAFVLNSAFAQAENNNSAVTTKAQTTTKKKKRYYFNVPDNSIQIRKDGFTTYTHHANFWGATHKGNGQEANQKIFEKMADSINRKIEAFSKEKGIAVPIKYTIEGVEKLGRAMIGESLYKVTIRANGVSSGCFDSPYTLAVARAGSTELLDVTGEDMFHYFGLKRRTIYTRDGSYDELLLSLCTDSDFAKE